MKSVYRVFSWSLLLWVLMPAVVIAQGDVINYDSGYTWRAYTGSEPPVCTSKLCHAYAVYPFDSYYTEFTAWKSLSGDPNSARAFINFRVLFPAGYNVNDQTKEYPVVIVMHGAGESGRVWTDHFNYEPTDPMYDNNGHQLRYGGNEHRAASLKPPSDPGSCRAIAVYPQASYSAFWGDLNSNEISENEQMLLAFIEEQIIGKYHGDRNRVVMHGISNGAREIWALATKRPDLFAGVIAMSAVPANYERTTDSLVTTPVRIFQGGLDLNPTPAASQNLVAMFEAKGASPMYTVYPEIDHDVWYSAYREPDFFSWIMARDKRNLHVTGGSTELCEEPITIGASAGMMAYQWTRNGADISGATERFRSVAMPGSYAVKFQRPDGQWVESFPVTITLGNGCVVTGVDPVETAAGAYPNPTDGVVTITTGNDVSAGDVIVVSMTGQRVDIPISVVERTSFNADLTGLPTGVYVIRLTSTGQSFSVLKR